MILARVTLAPFVYVLLLPAVIDAQPTVPSPAEDLLIFRDGAARSGSLAACIAETCRFDAVSIPLDELVWIGLSVGDEAPPSAAGLGIDQLYLRDGSMHPGKLVGISLETVVTERGSHGRDSVVWVQLAEPPPDDSDEPIPVGASEPAPPAYVADDKQEDSEEEEEENDDREKETVVDDQSGAESPDPDFSDCTRDEGALCVAIRVEIRSLFDQFARLRDERSTHQRTVAERIEQIETQLGNAVIRYESLQARVDRARELEMGLEARKIENWAKEIAATGPALETGGEAGAKLGLYALIELSTQRIEALGNGTDSAFNQAFSGELAEMAGLDRQRRRLESEVISASEDLSMSIDLFDTRQVELQRQDAAARRRLEQCLAIERANAVQDGPFRWFCP